MNLEKIFNVLIGPQGGIFAAGIMVGGVTGWTLSQRVLVNEAKLRISKLEEEVSVLRSELMAEIRKKD